MFLTLTLIISTAQTPAPNWTINLAEEIWINFKRREGHAATLSMFFFYVIGSVQTGSVLRRRFPHQCKRIGFIKKRKKETRVFAECVFGAHQSKIHYWCDISVKYNICRFGRGICAWTKYLQDVAVL